MKKLIVDGKEAEFDHSGGLKPLSEEELEGVHGGVFIKDGTMLYRWHCLVEG